ncbi:MAG: DUF2087 domain-containing protein [Actinomycetota bacterium]
MPHELTSRAIVGLLADRTRRLVVAGLLLGASEPSDIARQVGLDVRSVVDALDRLASGGLVEEIAPQEFHLLEEAFQMAARREAPSDPPSAFGDEPDDRRRVLDQSLRDGRLVAWPAKYSKRLVLLDHIAQRFEPGRRYTEQQVELILSAIDTDTATMRRYLVDAGLLDRGGGEYWRSGGTFVIDD